MKAKDRKNLPSCPECGKKIKKRDEKFCPSCGRELYTPRLPRNWNLKVIAVIILLVILFLVLFYLFKPVLYFNLDKV